MTAAEELTNELAAIRRELNAIVPKLDDAGVAKLATTVADAANQLDYLLTGPRSSLRRLLDQDRIDPAAQRLADALAQSRLGGDRAAVLDAGATAALDILRGQS